MTPRMENAIENTMQDDTETWDDRLWQSMVQIDQR